MYARNHIQAHSPNHCCHGNATTRSVFIFVDLYVAVNNIKVYSVAMEMQQWVPFALMPSCKVFLTAVNMS
jgi:hypothetical protein